MIKTFSLFIIILFSGYFPLKTSVCVIWLGMDVSMCTASIWHMCTMSMDRFFTLKYPMKYGRNKTKTMVVLKIAFVWIISIAISSPVLIIGFSDNSTVTLDNTCLITNRYFLLYGSITAFYIPLVIMVTTYFLTIKILHRNQKRMKKISKQHTELSCKISQHQQNGYSAGQYANTTFLSPGISRYSVRPSFDATATISRDASMNDICFQLGDSQSKGLDTVVLSMNNGGQDCPQQHQVQISQEPSSPQLLLSSLSASQPNLLDNSNSRVIKVRRSSSCNNRNSALAEDSCLRRSSSCKSRSSAVTSMSPLSLADGQKTDSSQLLNPHSDESTAAMFNTQSQPNLIGPSRSFPLQGSRSQSSFLRNSPHNHHHSGHHHSKHCSRTNVTGNKHGPVQRQLYAYSQPHLPSINRGEHLSPPMGFPLTFQFPSIKRINSILDLESVQNYDTISACSSINSCHSIWSDFQRPVMLEKLSQIEAEMDFCIMENSLNEESEDTFPEQEDSSFENSPQESPKEFTSQSSLHNGSESGDNNNVFIPPVCISAPTPNLSHEASPCRSSTEMHSEDEVCNEPVVSEGLLCVGLAQYTTSNEHCGSHEEISTSDIDQEPPRHTDHHMQNGQVVRETATVCSSQFSPTTVNTTSCATLSSQPTVNSSTHGSYLCVRKPNSCSSFIIINDKNPDNKTSLELEGIAKKRVSSFNDSGSSTEDNGLLTSDDCLSDNITETSQVTNNTMSQHISPKLTIFHHRQKQAKHTADLFRTLTSRVKKYPQIKLSNGSSYINHSHNVMSKRTANNERKASKVLGIIFAVFVLLWAPFFIVNILGGVCSHCLTYLTPATVTTLTWLGYMSSLANPIIYTMFNTAFRKAFYKILTCQYQFCIGYKNPQDTKYGYKYCYYKPSNVCNKTVTKTMTTSPSRNLYGR